jgi:hypothetical protein
VTDKLSMTSPLVPLASNGLLYGDWFVIRRLVMTNDAGQKALVRFRSVFSVGRAQFPMSRPTAGSSFDDSTLVFVSTVRHRDHYLPPFEMVGSGWVRIMGVVKSFQFQDRSTTQPRTLIALE